MEGSLESPPVVVRQSWWAWAIMPLAALAVIGFSYLESNYDRSRWPALSTALVVCACLFGLWKFLRPSRLEIWPDGIVWFNGIRTRAFSFSDIAKFDVFTISTGRGSYRTAGLVWARSAGQDDSPRGLAALFMETNSRQLFGSAWELSCEDLVALLNQALTRYAISHAKPPSAFAER